VAKSLASETESKNLQISAAVIIIKSINIRGYIRKHYLSALAWEEEYWNFEEEGITNAVAEIELLKERRNISGPVSTNLTKWLENLAQQSICCINRRFVSLDKNHIGLCPLETQEGDAISILHGSQLPIVLRSCGLSWKVVGPCYIDPIMYGEAVDWDEDEAETFTLGLAPRFHRYDKQFELPNYDNKR